jgi:uncharacterized pyridoxal phosphate-containing UPF0001 family protein
MSIKENILYFDEKLRDVKCRLVAVSKTHSPEAIKEAYDAGHRIFGENKVQELVDKYALLPHDITWHLLGHLQTNKVKYIAEFIDTIQSVDSLKLLMEINKRAEQLNRTLPINCYRYQRKSSFYSESEPVRTKFSIHKKALCYRGLFAFIGIFKLFKLKKLLE